MASASSGDAKMSIQDVQEAAKRIAPYIHKTPVMTCSTLDSLAGRALHFKCELFQKIGAFKVTAESVSGCCSLAHSNLAIGTFIIIQPLAASFKQIKQLSIYLKLKGCLFIYKGW